MACSNIRYGPGVTKEVGMDLVNLKAKHVGVFTDKNLIKLGPMKATLDSLTKAGVNFKVKVEGYNGVKKFFVDCITYIFSSTYFLWLYLFFLTSRKKSKRNLICNVNS